MPLSPALQAALSKSHDHTVVRDTAELRRVRALPVVRWQEDGERLAALWTEKLRRPGGTMKLRPIQGAMLEAAHRGEPGAGGMLAAARTGSGKLLGSLLIGAARGLKRPLVMIPASRAEPTFQAMREYGKHFHLPANQVLTYSALSQAGAQDIMNRLKPDGIIPDEAQCLKDSGGARWKRVKRWIRACEDPKGPTGGRPCALDPMSGTFAHRSMLEYWHYATDALGQGCPVPLDLQLALEWDRATNPRAKQPLGAGALLSLMPHLDGYEDSAVSMVGRRFVSAPGVISSGSDIPDIPLTCSIVNLPPTKIMQETAMHMRSTWMTPCEYPIDSALDMWRHEGELSNGFYDRWVDIPPKPWLRARQLISAFLRASIATGKWDLPSQVYAAVENGSRPDDGSVGDWLEIEPSYTPVMVPIWICDSTVRYAKEWLSRHGGIVWVGHGPIGERLSRESGVPFFREGACDERGVHIENHRGPAIASVHSCSTGHNLQHHNMNLFLTIPPSGTLEQAVSRTHRDGQESAVHVQFLCRLPSDFDKLDKARDDARSVGALLQVVQRVEYADWI